MEDLLIDIFIGRDPEDLEALNWRYQQHNSYVMSGRTLASAVKQLTSNAVLRSALMVCTEGTSTRKPGPVDQSLVYRDVAEIEKQLKTTFPESQILDILLRRQDVHIAQINVFFSMRTSMQLDEALRRNTRLDDMTKKIAVHAVRTATNLTYRDVMLLRDAMGNKLLRSRKDEKIGIRVCRMHWHRQHWRQIKAAYVGHSGKEFIDIWKRGNGLFKDLILSMASV